MPKINLSESTLNKIDFYPFKFTSAKLSYDSTYTYIPKLIKKMLQLFQKKLLIKLLEKK